MRFSADHGCPLHWDGAVAVIKGEALLGGVQLVVLHKGADGRRCLGGARLLERHLRGRELARAQRRMRNKPWTEIKSAADCPVHGEWRRRGKGPR